ncbi:MAG: CoA ester lyase [Pigmentiphaga sp.]|uniref:HpcH/HpaI aldolase/citrate lyase family protein n=1 Tax=Pigmentiphaga sp. TaxID=1977564 RepID=UPI0029B5B8BA|nr:CoA ester lyase [Pigmentiphaga sp.]MDX3904163.1 CoA ester lyase [Pigmentiphaga sp.]
MKSVRSALFVPADRPERLPKALGSGADAVIADLEDAVEASAKSAARHALAGFLDTHVGARVVVRVNAVDTPYFNDDLALCASLPGVAAVMLPKADSADIVRLAATAGKPVWPLVESARAVLALPELAQAPGAAQLVFGTLDFALDLGLDAAADAGRAVLDHVRHQLLLHARSAGLPGPLDGVHPRLDDAAGLRAEAARARAAGMGGMLCVHPSQVPIINESFQPSAEELDWARRVVQASTGQRGAFRLDGQMVDAPVVRRARLIIEQAG